MRRGRACLGAAVVATALGAGTLMAAEAVPTFNEDIAPIIYEKGASCHRPGEVAPLSLLSCQEARPWGHSSKATVATQQWRMRPMSD